jgi:hypothetical protein
VEQLALGRLEDVGLPAEVDGGSTAVMKGGTWLARRWSVDYAVLGQSVPSRPMQMSLLPLFLQASMTRVLLLNRGAHKLVQGAAPEQRQVLPKHRTEPLMEEGHLLLIGVGVVWRGG